MSDLVRTSWRAIPAHTLKDGSVAFVFARWKRVVADELMRAVVTSCATARSGTAAQPHNERRVRTDRLVDKRAPRLRKAPSDMTARPLVVGIAGGTGSGKSTVAHKLAAAIPEGRCVTIEHDSYYRRQGQLSFEDRARVNYDHPSSLETSLLVSHLRALREGQAVDVPIYDFAHHDRRDDTRHVVPAPVIVVEGILVFVEPELREQMDVKIFVDTDADIRLMRRIRRDLEQRGRSFQSVRDQYYATVRPMHLEHVEPSKRWADLIVPEGGDNHIALDVLLGRLGRIAFGDGAH
ncbi:MAG TPA: uridine kinase [Kofleriaceae bacterium]